MTWILQQGLRCTAAPLGSCLLRWGEIPTFSPGRTLVCLPQLDRSGPEIWCVEGASATRVSQERFGDSVVCEVEPGARACFSWTPWAREDVFLPSTAEQEFWIPLQAWIQGSWYDGSLQHIKQHQLQTFVGAGSEGQLWIEADVQSPRDDELEPEHEKRRGLLEKESLKLALQKRIGPLRDEALGYRLDRCDAQDLGLLLGLRLAFPELRIYPVLRGEMTPPWRRLLQNLNLETKPWQGLDSIRWLERSMLWPKEEAETFLQSLRRLSLSSPFLPPKLWPELEAKSHS